MKAKRDLIAWHHQWQSSQKSGALLQATGAEFNGFGSSTMRLPDLFVRSISQEATFKRPNWDSPSARIRALQLVPSFTFGSNTTMWLHNQRLSAAQKRSRVGRWIAECKYAMLIRCIVRLEMKRSGFRAT